jgi:hypothetical protein
MLGKIDAMFLQKKPPRAGSQLQHAFPRLNIPAQWSILKSSLLQSPNRGSLAGLPAHFMQDKQH